MNSEAFLIECFQRHNTVIIGNDFVNFSKTTFTNFFAWNDHFLKAWSHSEFAELLKKKLKVFFSINDEVDILFGFEFELYRKLVFFVLKDFGFGNGKGEVFGKSG